MRHALDLKVLDQLFTNARTHTQWHERPINEATIRRLYDLTKMGPTSANGCPARFVWIHSEAAKQRLQPCLAPGNVDQTMSAPLTVIVAMDMEFYEKMPELYPHTDARAWFVGNDALIQETAMRNSSLQGAYLIMAARSLGLDTGAMSGYDAAQLDKEFFAGTRWRSNFLLNIGYGDDAKVHKRHPRLSFEDACQLL